MGNKDGQGRCDLLNAVAAGIEKRFDDFLGAEMADTGKPDILARNYDIPRGAANFRIFADLVSHGAGTSIRQDTPDGAGAFNYTVRKPKGVVAVISPWNLPLFLMTGRSPRRLHAAIRGREAVEGDAFNGHAPGRRDASCWCASWGLQRRSWVWAELGG